MQQQLREEHILEIGRTYARTKGATELAKEIGVSKQRIGQIVTALRTLGVPIPRVHGRLTKLAEQLKKELNEENA